MKIRNVGRVQTSQGVLNLNRVHRQHTSQWYGKYWVLWRLDLGSVVPAEGRTCGLDHLQEMLISEM